MQANSRNQSIVVIASSNDEELENLRAPLDADLKYEQVDAVVALPGGTGTLEELFEVVSLKKLGLFHQPIILVNTQGFFNPLLEMMDKMVEEEFMREAHLQLWQVVEKADEVVQAIQQTPQWDKDAIRFAAV